MLSKLTVVEAVNATQSQIRPTCIVRHQIECFNAVCKDFANNLQDELAKHLFGKEDGLTPLNLSDPKRASCAFKTVGVAYAAAHYNGSDFVGSIMDIIQHGGDTVGNAMVTGGVIGIKLGFFATRPLDARHVG